MSTPKRCVCTLLLALLVIPWAPLALASAYDGHPRLVIILVIDQFRADYLDRYRADFKGRGFRLFLDKGAYFETATTTTPTPRPPPVMPPWEPGPTPMATGSPPTTGGT